MTHPEKVEHAKKILRSFAPHVSLTVERGRYFFHWKDFAGKPVRRQWMTRGGSDYPVWYNMRPFGGTGCVALSALVKWLRGGELYLPWWEYVTGPTVALGSAETLELVKSAK